jgi:hypothetical protein
MRRAATGRNRHQQATDHSFISRLVARRGPRAIASLFRFGIWDLGSGILESRIWRNENEPIEIRDPKSQIVRLPSLQRRGPEALRGGVVLGLAVPRRQGSRSCVAKNNARPPKRRPPSFTEEGIYFLSKVFRILSKVMLALIPGELAPLHLLLPCWHCARYEDVRD